MQLEKANALALRIRPYSNTSHVVTWLTESGEKLSTMIKGACRPKSAFLGQYDLFSTTELVYYRGSGESLSIARECALVSPRARLRHDWRAFACASYAAQLVLTSSMDGERHPYGYQLAEGLLDALNASNNREQALFWFELQWLGHLGLAPRLDACSRCARPLAREQPPAKWGRDGLVCGPCSADRQAGARETLAPLRPDILAILRRWQEQPQTQVMATTQCSSAQLLVLSRILGTFVGYHIEHLPESRKIALDLVNAGFGKGERK